VEALSFVCLLSISRLRGVDYNPNMSSLSSEQKANLRKFVAYTRSGARSLQEAGITNVFGGVEHNNMDGPTGWVTAPPEANSAGMRDNREYDTVSPHGITRMLAFGDSFTYGDEVALEDAWTKRITALAPSVDVLNYGVRAYGLDQAYLRYLAEGVKYHPHVVLIGYMVEDLNRDVIVFRPFYTHSPFDFWAKPRFQLRNGQLALLRNPMFTVQDYENLLYNDAQVLKELGKNDYYYQNNYSHGRFDFLPSIRLAKVLWKVLALRFQEPMFKSDGSYNVKSEAYRVTERIFDAFYSKVLEDGAQPVIVVFPKDIDLERGHRGEIRRYAALLDYFRSKGYKFIDTQNALECTPFSRGELFAHSGHFSPRGNQIVAEYILAQLKGWDLVDALKAGQMERGLPATEGP